MIHCVYAHEPRFPASEQHHGAQRSVVSGYWVDWTGTPPTEAEVMAVMARPEPSPREEMVSKAQVDVLEARLNALLAAIAAAQNG